jgi:tRNA A-37 threonylcarbamoyl transferase component Bud32/ligand-binding sensor domain-containing protein
MKMLCATAYAVLGLLIGAASDAFAQQYPFLPVAGSPKNVKALFEDSRGRLWLGGDRLAFFDGNRFFFLVDYGFPAVASYSITEDANGAIWIGAETGVYRFSDGRIEEISKGVATSVTAVTPEVAVAAMGPLGRGVPINASLLIIRRIGNSWKTETVMSLNSPGPLTLDHAGRLLYVDAVAGGWNELSLVDIAGWRTGKQLPVKHNPVPGDNGLSAGPSKVLRDRFGCVWIGSDGQNIYDCGENTWPQAPFEGASVRSDFHEAPDGSMVLVGYNILAVGRPGSFRVAQPANGLPQLFVANQARDGTIWLGGAQGLYRFASPFRMEYWTARDGVDSPWCVQRSGANIYAGLNRDVAVLSEDRQHWQSLASFGKVGQVMNLLSLSDGTLLAALNPGGAATLRRDGTVLARTHAPFVGDYGLRLARTSDQEVWLGGISLGHLTGAGTRLNFENHRLETQPAGNVLDVQYEEHTRKLWACYNGGLVVRSENGSWREITTKDGLLVDPCWSLAALPNGDVWYGYYNTPAFALIHPIANGRFTIRQYRGGGEVHDPESVVFDIDQRGWLWRGGNQGLSVADPADAEAGRWLFLNQSDGLSGESSNGGSYFADSDGSIWLGMDISIFHYLPPSDLLNPQFSPQLYLSAFSWDGTTPEIAEAVAGLPHGSKIVAHIGSLQFDRRNNLRIRYRVLPEQSSWRESSSLDLQLGSLSSGAHTLEVQGRVFTGPWSTTMSRSITVLVPIWQSWPLLLLYAISGSMLVGAGYLVHRRRKAEDAVLLPDLAAWRLGALLPEVHELAGTLLDSRFEVGELLARGGFANVMDGYDREQKHRCAVKVFRNEVKDQAWIQRGFEQEVAALKKVRHPNVVSIYAHGSTPSGTPYLVMEFVEGRNLREVLEIGALPSQRCARFLSQLAGALDAIHAQDIWHRDVRPENVIIRDEGSLNEQAVLIDFSIAIVKDANETLHGLSRAAGSFDYMAPEQVIGYAESSSDIYSLAKVAIEILTGRRLSELLPAASLDLADHVRELLRSLNVRLADDTVLIFASALEFDPGKRPRVAGDFARPLIRDLELDAQIRHG